MPTATQFEAVYQARALLLSEEVEPQSSKRWRIWVAQKACGDEPCFGTAQRDTCRRYSCAWREDCLLLRAEWQR